MCTGGEGGRGAVEVGEGGCQGARQGRAPLLPIESRNEEVMLPLTLEIQMRAMARTLLRREGACIGRGSPLRRDEAQCSSVRAQRKRGYSKGMGAVGQSGCD